MEKIFQQLFKKYKPMYVVEFSQSQKAFHISTFQERLVNEILCAINGVVSDYKVVQECDTYDEASDFVQETLMEKSQTQKP